MRGLRSNKSVTLLELLIAVALLSVVVLGLTSIDFFSRNNVISADYKAALQNKIYLGLEHVRKNAVVAIGNERIDGARNVIDTVDMTFNSEGDRLKIYADRNGDGARGAGDGWIAYRANYETADGSGNKYQLLYCSQCPDKTCTNCTTGWVSVCPNIMWFDVVKTEDGSSFMTDNYLDITMTACLHPEWSEAGNPGADCGSSSDNPQTRMTTRILLPAVSIN